MGAQGSRGCWALQLLQHTPTGSAPREGTEHSHTQEGLPRTQPHYETASGKTVSVTPLKDPSSGNDQQSCPRVSTRHIFNPLLLINSIQSLFSFFPPPCPNELSCIFVVCAGHVSMLPAVPPCRRRPRGCADGPTPPAASPTTAPMLCSLATRTHMGTDNEQRQHRAGKGHQPQDEHTEAPPCWSTAGHGQTGSLLRTDSSARPAPPATLCHHRGLSLSRTLLLGLQASPGPLPPGH